MTLLDGALVGVIVTDGVMVRLEPARLNPIGSLEPGVLGVRVAPPGRDGCLCVDFVTGVMLIGDPRLTGVAVTAFDDFEWAGRGTAFVGVTLSEPFVSAAGMAASGLLMFGLLGVTIKFSFIITC